MRKKWSENIDSFIALTNRFDVRMIMVGGGAVNFHGYQRHSADIDFWIETTPENLDKLVLVFKEMGYEIQDFPMKVKKQRQNISVKFSPVELNLELITKFEIGKTFDEAFKEAENAEIKGEKLMKWKVLSLENLLISKVKAGRPKDLLDIQQLKEINN